MKQRRSLIVVVLAVVVLVEAYAQEPFVGIEAGSDTLYWYMGVPVEIPIIAGPARGTVSLSANATLTPVNAEMGRYRATLSNPEEGSNEVCVTVEEDGRKASQCIQVVVWQPEMVTGIDRWSGMRAMIGRKYNPSSEWKSLDIPAAHYQTVVDIDGREVFNRFGISFREGELPDDMMVTEGMKDIHTTIYWKPNGTADRTRWVAIATNFGTASRRRFEISYPAPEQIEGSEFDWLITSRSPTVKFGPIVLVQNLGHGKQLGVKPTLSCDECAEFGVSASLHQNDETEWELSMSADPSQLNPAINGRHFKIFLMLEGRGGATAAGSVDVTVSSDPSLFSAGANASVDSAASGASEPSFGPIAGKRIEALKPFKGKKIAIFAIKGYLRDTIVAHMEAADKGDIERVQELCQTLYEEPLANCFNTMLKIVSSERTNYGKNVQAVKFLMARQYNLDPEDIDDGEMMEMLNMVMAVKARREARPNTFYAVTSQEKRPRMLGIVSVFDDGRITFQIRDIFTGSTLNQGLKSLGPRMEKELPGMLPSAMADQEWGLMKIWPEEKAADR
jgi:hypothetical protein